jgi:hypothetical protein
VIFHEVFTTLKDTPGQMGEVLRAKMKYVLKNNPDFEKISKIADFLTE